MMRNRSSSWWQKHQQQQQQQQQQLHPRIVNNNHNNVSSSIMKYHSFILILSILLNVIMIIFIIQQSLQNQQQQLNQHNTKIQISIVNEQQQIYSTEISFNGGNPYIHSINGSCWCNEASYCLCTPSLAIDLVIVTKDASSNEDYIWLVRRNDTNQLATLGGFVQIGESVEDAVLRELKEETGITITDSNIIPQLFGIYSDPRRDNRCHTISIAYVIQLDGSEKPVASDDVKDVIKISINDIELYTFFADHITILLDYRKILYYNNNHMNQSDFITSNYDFVNNITRSVCIPI